MYSPDCAKKKDTLNTQTIKHSNPRRPNCVNPYHVICRPQQLLSHYIGVFFRCWFDHRLVPSVITLPPLSERRRWWKIGRNRRYKWQKLYKQQKLCRNGKTLRRNKNRSELYWSCKGPIATYQTINVAFKCIKNKRRIDMYSAL